MLPGVGYVPYGGPRRTMESSDLEHTALRLSRFRVRAGWSSPGGLPCGSSRLADRTGCYLLFDEVQTGAGRTGHFLAAEHEGVAPDGASLAKGLGGGLPIGAFLAGPALR